ncbi:hypothetical protein [Aromatoleum anaerobium]|uniref:Lipoprotein n=1 Tax=Aromatoleum anaerobium TaxID=182180 RepID=A0ABX1PPP5_9RHOO|nr:hypothetical protein [Aromatoleum anaerobium]MCK0507950.1 hypothetical protein [Aromatoleum anaerobium]
MDSHVREENMKTQYVVLAPMVAALVGCASPAPVPVNFQMSHQKVARTAHHWDVVADDVVSETLREIAEKAQLQGRGVFVAPTRNSAFNTAFREFMITRMVNRGANVSVCRGETGGAGGFAASAPDVEIVYDIQLVKHGDDLPAYQPPRWTLLAAGVAVVRDVILDGHGTAGTIGGIALGEWGAGHWANPTRTEIIVTTTIAENNRFVSRKSDIYYVPENDTKLFMQRVAQRSPCPGEKQMAAAGEEESNAEFARQQMIERGMARSNPKWRSSAAYSY